MKTLRGGTGPISGILYGPSPKFKGDVIESYLTVANGRADEIRPGSGEIAVRVQEGNPYCFSVWVMGTLDELWADQEIRPFVRLAHQYEERAYRVLDAVAVGPKAPPVPDSVPDSVPEAAVAIAEAWAEFNARNK